jgi:general stress protein 26
MSTDTLTEQQLWPLINGIKFAMFTTTHHTNGHLHSRPMTTLNKSMPDDKLWFFMSKKGGAALELTQQPQVNISYADPGKDAYVSVSGLAQVVDDKIQRQALWTKFAQAWFPGGVDDPDLALVRVTVSHAHYWNVSESKLTQLFVMAKAVFGGEKPALGESGEVVLNGSSEKE